MQTHDPQTLLSTPEGLDACMCDVSLASGDQSPGKEFRKPLCEMISGVLRREGEGKALGSGFLV